MAKGWIFGTVTLPALPLARSMYARALLVVPRSMPMRYRVMTENSQPFRRGLRISLYGQAAFSRNRQASNFALVQTTPILVLCREDGRSSIDWSSPCALPHNSLV